MKVRVDPDVCTGFSICIGICPKLFDLHAHGYAVVLADEVPPELEDLARQAAKDCPVRAISIDE